MPPLSSHSTLLLLTYSSLCRVSPLSSHSILLLLTYSSLPCVSTVHIGNNVHCAVPFLVFPFLLSAPSSLPTSPLPVLHRRFRSLLHHSSLPGPCLLAPSNLTLSNCLLDVSLTRMSPPHLCPPALTVARSVCEYVVQPLQFQVVIVFLVSVFLVFSHQFLSSFARRISSDSFMNPCAVTLVTGGILHVQPSPSVHSRLCVVHFNDVFLRSLSQLLAITALEPARINSIFWRFNEHPFYEPQALFNISWLRVGVARYQPNGAWRFSPASLQPPSMPHFSESILPNAKNTQQRPAYLLTFTHA